MISFHASEAYDVLLLASSFLLDIVFSHSRLKPQYLCFINQTKCNDCSSAKKREDSTQTGGEVENTNPLVLHVKANAEDNPQYHEPMNNLKAHKAMIIKFDELKKKNA